MQLFLAFLVALFLTAALIPVLARWGPRLGLTDRPGPRKVHSTPVPRVGGIAMALGILVPALLILQVSSPLRGLLLGMLVLLVVGVWDDRVELGYRAKLVGQILAVALCIGLGGVHIESFTLGDRFVLGQGISWILTFVFLLGVTNAVNLSDGLDGLAAGMALLCFCAMALLGAASANGAVVTLALIEAGAILGFLRFNTHPARVFMGDSGSQVLGFTIGVLAIHVTQGESSTVSAALPLFLVGMPIIDTLAVMVQRLREGRSPFAGDRNHLHHRLLALGMSHGEAVATLYLLQVTLFLLGYFLRFESDVAICLLFAVFSGAVLGMLRWADRTGWRAHPDTQPRRTLTLIRGLKEPLRRLPAWSLGTMGVGLFAYGLTVVAESRHVGGDVALLCLALLALLFIAGASPKLRPAQWLERAAAYVSVVLIVYLDQTAPQKAWLLSHLTWSLLAITAVAALVRLWLSTQRRFQVTTLDVLVIFVALVIPNLPGFIELPGELAAGLTKAVLLVYVIEMLLSLDLKRPLPRAGLMLMLGLVAVRGLVAFSV